MQQGDCFLNDPAPGLPSHFWVVLSDPSQNSNDILLVNYTDAGNIADDSCELDSADHPTVITKPTRVAYQFAMNASLVALSAADAANLLHHKDAVPSATLQKILDGADATDELKNAHRQLLQDQGFIP